MKSCIDCFNCKLLNDKVKCAKEQWIDNQGTIFEYTSLDCAQRVSRAVKQGEKNGYMAYANFCEYLDE